MDPSTVAAQPGRTKPPWWWTLVTLIAGGAGALGSVAAAGSGTYDVAPFEVELKAVPALLGKTVLAVQPDPAVPGIPLGRAEAGTHKAPLEVRATIVGVNADRLIQRDLALFASPHDLASYLSREGKEAGQSFAIKLAAMAAAGGAGAGLLVSFGRWRRIVGGMVAGVLAFAIVGLLMAQTYDTDEFRKTNFVFEPDSRSSLLPLPS